MKGILGKKLGMARMPDSIGNITSVTLIEVSPNTVLEVKKAEKDGKNALILATGNKKRVQKNRYANFSYVREIIFDSVDGIEVGAQVDLDRFQIGEKVHITGVSKGKGFQGVMKRHNFACNPDSHGHEDHREPGGFGGRTWPGRVSKGRKLPGRMGMDTITLKNRAIVSIDKDMHILAVQGPVPGSINSFVKLWQ